MSMKTKNKRIPYGKQWIGKEEIRAVTAVLKSDFLTQGPKVQEFEKNLAAFVGAKYAVAVSSGTAALHLAAMALDLKPGDEVITTPISFLATSNAALYVGAKPVFVDIDPETQCLDPELIEGKITPKTKAIFVTDFAGRVADLKAIAKLARKYKLRVVEDAAHSLGAADGKFKVGSCSHVDLTIFSFHPVKHITTGEGGAVTTNDSAVYERLCCLRNHGVTRDPQAFRANRTGSWYYEMHELGFNYRLTDIQAAIGVEQLKKVKFFIRRRRQIAKMYDLAFADLPFVKIPASTHLSEHVYHLYNLRLQGRLLTRRLMIFEELRNRGIGVQVHYVPLPLQPYYQKLGYSVENLPQTTVYYYSAFSLPIFPKIKTEEVKRVIKAVKDVIFLCSK